MASLKRRGDGYYLQYYLPGKKQRRINLHTDCFQIAREKLRRFESAELMEDAPPLPTRTPIAKILTAYLQHIRLSKTPKSAQTETYYLRDVFGPICPALRITSRKISPKVKKRPPKPGQDRRFKATVIERQFFEQITTTDIASFITSRVSSRALAPKTANHYRGILVRLFNWATSQQGIRMPDEKNPAAVERYRERAPEISFLSMGQIDEQLAALENNLQMQVMVAVLIYAGLRREELLWLMEDDVDFAAGRHGIIRVRAKTVAGQSWQPKTKVNRGVPISSQLRLYLDKWRLKGRKSQLVFPNSKGGRYDPDNFSSDLRILNARAGLDWTNLDFRHTFGSQLAMKGESLYKIATLMGNSPEICRRHYAALLPESLVTSVEFGMESSRTFSVPVMAPRIVDAERSAG